MLAFWSHALGAVAFASVLLWQARGWAAGAAHRLLLGALTLTAAAAWLAATVPGTLVANLAETARNLVWVSLLYVLSGTDSAQGGRQRGVAWVYASVALVLGASAVVEITAPLAAAADRAAILASLTVLRTIAAAGALILVHNLYGQAAAASRGAIRLPMLGLALIWCYELNLYTMATLEVPFATALADASGIALVLAAPFFALARTDSEAWRLKLSRAATFQSLSLLAICSYFAVMALLAATLRAGGLDWLRGLAILVLAGMTVALAVLLPSRAARSWTKVKIAKHFFEHRYDYRAEWLRFAAMLGDHGAAEPLADRIVRAFADILEAPAGLLLAQGHGGRPTIAGSWHWSGRLPQAALAGEGLERLWPLLVPGRVLELDAHRYRWGSAADLAFPVPGWLRDEASLWAGIPLVHGEEVVGLVLLCAPELRRPLDWEDFDLLRTAGRQAAAGLAEQFGQQRMSESRRFDEFNRRFAFILHDIKNLVSQLKLLARNAERHADNPEFRTDMIATLRSSVGKMTDLLARLTPASDQRPAKLKPTPLRPLVAALVAARRANHDITLNGDGNHWVFADPLLLEQAIDHLLQNAVDASAPSQGVTVRMGGDGHEVTIAIVDDGPGMDSDFIRTRLFQPFASTKDGGFGVGAFEARSLVAAMGGRLSVDSRPGKGSRFTIHLPESQRLAEPKRKRA